LATFDEKRAITRKRYKIDTQFLLKLNRKSYALYHMVMFPMTLGDPLLPKPSLHFSLPFIIFVVSKVTGSRVYFKSGSVLKTVLDKDVETTVHKQSDMPYGHLIAQL